ncbi:MAG: haloalkane dehalogenase [Myxococcales bacterium]|jgi:haloalkane dehalogenase
MRCLRTPDERFANLPGYDFASHYLEVPDDDGDRLRVHYLDEGPPDGQVVLCMHGEPSWSYLYRKMIPVLAAAGHRVVVPDLVGFGRSDKPTEQSDYTCARHVAWMTGLVRTLDLRGITLVCQDWGGLVGLRIAAENPERFARLCVANTGLPTGEQTMPEAFMKWREFSQTADEFPVGAIVNGGTTSDLPPEVVAAYDAPFPDDSYKAGARIFPALVPITPDDPAAAANRRAWEVLRRWEKPLLTAFSDSDPITRGGEAVFHKLVPGAQGQPHTTIEGAGHFLQEDRGEQLARVVVDWMAG